MANQEYSRAALTTAAACAIGMMVSVVPFHIGTFPLFLGPVSAEFGWGRAEFAMSVNMAPTRTPAISEKATGTPI